MIMTFSQHTWDVILSTVMIVKNALTVGKFPFLGNGKLDVEDFFFEYPVSLPINWN